MKKKKKKKFERIFPHLSLSSREDRSNRRREYKDLAGNVKEAVRDGLTEAVN